MLLQSDTQLNQTSYYEASAQRQPLAPPLQGDVHADVVVVGAGFAGLSSAIELANASAQSAASQQMWSGIGTLISSGVGAYGAYSGAPAQTPAAPVAETISTDTPYTGNIG
jgi:gamma-glutamylputrescine oxidase